MFEEEAEGEAWLRKATALQPDFSSARVLLVYLYYRRGNGVRMLQSLSGDPEYERILRDVRRQIAQMTLRAGKIGFPQ